VTVLIDQTDTPETPTSRAFLDVRDLRVRFPSEDGLVSAVEGLSYTVERGKTLGIVGESGSGKSVSAQAILGLHKGTRAEVTGEIWLDGQELIAMSADDIRRLRGSTMAMIFQDPLSSLHPFYTIGDQIIEGYRVHNKVSKSDAKKRAIEMLDRVGIPNASKRVDEYPHQFSGGMRQRAMIAMALVNNPALLIADEPTTALDVTVQAQILGLLKDLQSEFNSAVVIITHDLGVVAEVADDVTVMYGGRGVEQGSVRDVFYRPQMPYTWGLLSSMPRLDRERKSRLNPIPGTPPSLINIPPGCVFSPRCTYQSNVEATHGEAICRTEAPELVEYIEGHLVRCHLTTEQRENIWTNEVKPKL
jgi:peptide/nickel transport system ATP-binding protein